MKKLFIIQTTLILSFLLVGCQNANNSKMSAQQNQAILSEIENQNTELKNQITELKDLIASVSNSHDNMIITCQDHANMVSDHNNALRKDIQTMTKELKNNKQAYKSETVVATVKNNTKLDDGKLIFGESEWIYIVEANTTFDSRIDSGASISSINASNIEQFERDGEKWYRFDIPMGKDKVIKMEAPFVRSAVIRQASTDGKLEERPVVKLTIKIANLTQSAEFSLRDRSKMQYTLLIGREFIKDLAVVDVSRDHVQPKVKPESANSIGALKFSKEKGEFIQNSRQVEVKEQTTKNIPAKPKDTNTKKKSKKD